MDDPRPPAQPHVVMEYDKVRKVLLDQHSFKVPWAKILNQMQKDKDYSSFMLGGDGPANTQQRNLVGSIIYGPADFKNLLFDYVTKKATAFLDEESFKVSRTSKQIDLIRDVVIPVNAYMIGDLLSLDLKTPENPKGSLHMAELYGRVLDVRTWGFSKCNIMERQHVC